jgi:PAS domain S-box-containing protein
MKHITKSGKDLWTMATYTCIRGDEGEVERILFLAIDSTEQKQLSLNFEGIVDAVDRVGINLEFDIGGAIKNYNESFLFLFRYSEEEINGLAVFDLIDPNNLENFNNRWENIINGMSFQGLFKVRTKGDEERWLRGAFSAVYDMYGDVSKVIYIGHDITNEKQLEIEMKHQNELLKKQEKQLRDSEKQLSNRLREAKHEMILQYKEMEKIKMRNERTLEGALDAIITTSNDNRIVFFNNAAEQLLGYNKEEVMGKSIEMLFDTKSIDNDPFVASYVGPGNQKNIGMRKEVKMLAKNNNEVPVIILLSMAELEDETTYTAFIQNLEVELF